MIRRPLLALVVAFVSIFGCAPATHTRVHSDAALYPEPRESAITFWGHACSYIDLDGFGIVTDPVFSGRWAVIRRRLIPVPPREAYDQTRVVLISHAHHDHLDPEALGRFSSHTAILAPAPAAKYLLARGIRAQAMKPGHEYPFPGGTIIAVAALHPGGRLGMKARADGRALGYVIRTAGTTIYYSGDTDYFEGFASVGAAYRPGIVLLNVNRHLHSADALAAIADLGAPVVIPTHYGAYSGPSARLASRWRRELVQALGSTIVPLEVGESFRIPAARPPLAESGAGRRLIASGRGIHAVGAVPGPRGVPNFSEIRPGLTRGGQPTEEGIQSLRERGYRTIVSLRSNQAERDRVARAGMSYVEIPMRAGILGATPPTDEQVRLFLSVVTDTSRYPVFIHCRRGKDRTGVMSAIYRIDACGWTADEAVREMKTLGFSSHYRKMLKFVRSYRLATALRQ